MSLVFARQSDMRLPVTIEGSDLVLPLAVAALIAAVPALYAYRRSPAAALRG